jgi:RNA polymerase sigma factor (sigma-70 family)
MNVELIDRIRQGDREAEQELILQYVGQIQAIVRYQLGGLSKYSEDLTNDICLALIENLRNGKFDPNQGQLGSYVYGIARNKISDFKTKEKQTAAKEIAEKDLPVTPEISQQIEEQELQDIMRSELTRLKPKYRKVLLLRYYMDRSIPEIAETHSNRYHREQRRGSARGVRWGP